MQRQEMVDLSMIILVHATLHASQHLISLFGSLITLRLLLVLHSAEISKNGIWKVTLQRLGVLDFSCYFFSLILYLAVGPESVILIISINIF